jgi:DivIVA domain-containing protein
MSATHLDLPVLMSDEQIRRREFVVIRRGYDPAQVRDFLERVGDQVGQLGTMLRDAQREALEATRGAAQARTDPYAELADRVAGVLRAADGDAEAIRGDATRDAERILMEARADAERIRADAEAGAEEIQAQAQAALREAREHADRTLAGLSTKREAVVEQLAAMQERLVGVARELGSTIDLPEADGSAILETTMPPQGVDDAGSPLPALREAMWATELDEPPQDDAGATEAEEGSQDDAGETEATQVSRTIVLGEPDEQLMDGVPGEMAETEGDLDDDAQLALLDRAVEGIWDPGETAGLEMPEIPPLDLDWGEIPSGEADRDEERDEDR